MPVQCRDGNFPAWGGKSAASSPEPVKHPCKGSRGEGAETGARRDAKGKQRLHLSACLIVSVLLSIMAVFNSQFQHLMHCIIFLNVDYQPQFNCFWLGMTRSLLTCQLFSFYQMGRGVCTMWFRSNPLHSWPHGSCCYNTLRRWEALQREGIFLPLFPKQLQLQAEYRTACWTADGFKTSSVSVHLQTENRLWSKPHEPLNDPVCSASWKMHCVQQQASVLQGRAEEQTAFP